MIVWFLHSHQLPLTGLSFALGLRMSVLLLVVILVLILGFKARQWLVGLFSRRPDHPPPARQDRKVIDVQQRQKSLLETFRDVHANGADLDPKTGVRMPRRE